MVIVKLVKFIKIYFMFCGLSLHALIVVLYFYDSSIVYAVTDKIELKVKLAINPNTLVDEQKNRLVQINSDVLTNFGQWQPLNTTFHHVEAGMIKVGNATYLTFAEALEKLQDNQTMLIGEGVYHEPLVIKKNNVQIIGVGHVVIDGAIAEGKGAILTKGNNINIANIECRNIKVSDRNGTCIRSENANLTVNHVYFHDSEEGILTANSESLHITDSRFEKLGKDGYAHGVYIGSGELYIDKCLFISSVSEGHEVKSRAKKTVITNSVIASLFGNDSRLIDISNGGELIISDSILEKGPQSVNATAIGYGLEGMKHAINRIMLNKSVIILERDGFNKLFDVKPDANVPLITSNNIVISKDDVELEGLNWIYSSRKEAKIADYPTIPVLENYTK